MDFIGIDVGTSGCKASVISELGTVKKSAQREYRIQRNKEGWAFLSLSVIWKCVKEILKEISDEASDVKAAAVSSLGETIAILDENDRLLLDEGITYIDSRNTEVWNTLKKRIAEEELYQITGKTQPHIATVNQYNYWNKKNPELFENAKKILFVDSFVAYMLSGEAMFDYSTASNTLVYDINTYQWSSRLAELFEINLELFPQVSRTGSRLGRIRRKVSEELNLPADMEILTGCHDQISATIGGGVTRAGDAVLGEGSTEALNLLIDYKQMQHLKAAHLPIEPFVKKEMYISLLSRLMHGTCIKWFVNNFASMFSGQCRSKNQNVYDVLNENCAEDSGGIVFLPYLSTTYFPNMNAPMGTFIGMDMTTDIYHLYRAVLEGLSCETAYLFGLLSEYGIEVHHVTASGGASKSSVYMQIKANITGREINTLKHTEAGINGLAMLCAVECGCYSNLDEASRQFSKIKDCFKPQRDDSQILERFRRFSTVIKEAYSGLQ